MKKFLLFMALFTTMGLGSWFVYMENERPREIYVYKKGKLIDKCSKKVLWNKYDVFKCEKVKSYLGFPSVEYSDGKYMVHVNF